MKNYFFFDLDGVIINSINECFIISYKAYYGFTKNIYKSETYKKLFFKFRGYVVTAKDFLILHRLINKLLSGKIKNINNNNFMNLKHKTSSDELLNFENMFFYCRYLYQNVNMNKWLKMHTLTNFGHKINNFKNKNIYIITSKDFYSSKLIIDHFNINVKKIFSTKEISRFKNKGNLIKDFVNKKKNVKVFFTDDSITNLESVNDKNVVCLFANWGYGKNNNDIFKSINSDYFDEEIY